MENSMAEIGRVAGAPEGSEGGSLTLLGCGNLGSSRGGNVGVVTGLQQGTFFMKISVS